MYNCLTKNHVVSPTVTESFEPSAAWQITLWPQHWQHSFFTTEVLFDQGHSSFGGISNNEQLLQSSILMATTCCTNGCVLATVKFFYLVYLSNEGSPLWTAIHAYNDGGTTHRIWPERGFGAHTHVHRADHEAILFLIIACFLIFRLFLKILTCAFASFS